MVLLSGSEVSTVRIESTADLARSCELVVRLALSCVTAPPADTGVADLVRGALHRQPVVP